MAIVAYYRMNGNSNDASGNGNNGADTNITYSNSYGKLNQGGGFNGTSSKIVISNAAILRPVNFTISAVIKTTNNGNWKEIFQNNYAASVYWSGFEFRKSASNTLNLWVGRGTSNIFTEGETIRNVYSTKVINDGKLHHVCGTVDNSYLKIYIDGVLDGESSWIYNVGYSSSDNRIRIGCNNYNGSTETYFWDGSIDEVILDNTAWSLAKIKNQDSYYKGFF